MNKLRIIYCMVFWILSLALVSCDSGDTNESTAKDAIPGKYIIEGSGFGTKSGIAYFEDFEAASYGEIEFPYNNLDSAWDEALSIVKDSHSGSKALENDFSVFDFPKVHRDYQDKVQKGYIACWMKFIKDGEASGVVWKFTRFSNGVLYSGTNKFSAEYTGTTNGPAALSASCYIDEKILIYNKHNEVKSAPDALKEGQWIFYEAEIDSGTVDGEDCFVEERVNGVPTIRFSGFSFRTTAHPELLNHVLTPMVGLGNKYPVRMQLDDVYTDGSRARVVLTDNEVYKNSTKWAIQPVESFSDTEVVAAKRRAAFTIGEKAYVHIFNDNGVLVHTSDVVTVTEDDE